MRSLFARRCSGLTSKAVAAVALLALAFGSSGPARATVRSSLDEARELGDWCANHEANIAADFKKYSDPADDAGWKASGKGYERDARGEAKCGEAKSDYADAYLASWQAQLLHHDGKDWKDELDSANALLQKCATQGAGTDRGTKCDADLKANQQRAASWSAPPGS